MAKRKHEKFWSGTGKFILFTLSVYGLIWLAGALADYAKNRTREYSREDVEIEGNLQVPAEKILKLCGFDDKKDRRVAIDEKELARKILAINFVRGVSITRRLPRVLNITVEEREPVAFIYGKGLNLIDRDGWLLPVSGGRAAWDLPMISGIREPLGRQGSKTESAQALLALQMLLVMENKYPLLRGLISELNFEKRNYVRLFLVKGGAEVRVESGSFAREMHILQSFMLDYMDWAELGKIQYIDLRFKNQLVLKDRT